MTRRKKIERVSKQFSRSKWQLWVFFLNNDMIKNMIKNVHLIKTMNDLRAKITNEAKDWLNKYDKKLLKLVIVIVIIAKEKFVARKLTIRRNVETIQKSFIFQSNDDVIQENEIDRLFLNEIIYLSFNAKTFFNNDNILHTFIITRIMNNLRIFRRKKQEFVLKNIDSSLRSRNASFFIRVLMSQKRKINRVTNRFRRDFAIRIELIRKNNLNF
jgi:hypothetical protein